MTKSTVSVADQQTYTHNKTPTHHAETPTIVASPVEIARQRVTQISESMVQQLHQQFDEVGIQTEVAKEVEASPVIGIDASVIVKLPADSKNVQEVLVIEQQDHKPITLKDDFFDEAKAPAMNTVVVSESTVATEPSTNETFVKHDVLIQEIAPVFDKDLAIVDEVEEVKLHIDKNNEHDPDATFYEPVAESATIMHPETYAETDESPEPNIASDVHNTPALMQYGMPEGANEESLNIDTSTVEQSPESALEEAIDEAEVLQKNDSSVGVIEYIDEPMVVSEEIQAVMIELNSAITEVHHEDRIEVVAVLVELQAVIEEFLQDGPNLKFNIVEQKVAQLLEVLNIEADEDVVKQLVSVLVHHQTAFSEVITAQYSFDQGTREIINAASNFFQQFNSLLEPLHTLLGRTVLGATAR